MKVLIESRRCLTLEWPVLSPYSIGIYTIKDLANFDYDTLANYFGEKGARRLIDNANGLDDSEVVPNEEIEIKSNGAEKTFKEDVSDEEILKDALFEFSERISKNLRELDKKAKTIVLKIKFNDFTSITRNVTINKATNLMEQRIDLATEHENELEEIILNSILLIWKMLQ